MRQARVRGASVREGPGRAELALERWLREFPVWVAQVALCRAVFQGALREPVDRGVLVRVGLVRGEWGLVGCVPGAGDPGEWDRVVAAARGAFRVELDQVAPV
ncbi:MAG: hypothetical protein ACKOJF_31660 [Planctomycetaceae bacterium]